MSSGLLGLKSHSCDLWWDRWVWIGLGGGGAWDVQDLECWPQGDQDASSCTDLKLLSHLPHLIWLNCSSVFPLFQCGKHSGEHQKWKKIRKLQPEMTSQKFCALSLWQPGTLAGCLQNTWCQHQTLVKLPKWWSRIQELTTGFSRRNSLRSILNTYHSFALFCIGTFFCFISAGDDSTVKTTSILFFLFTKQLFTL